MGFFQNKSLVKNFKFIWKTLVTVILFVLLVTPQPVLALVNTKTIQNYVTSVRLELNGLLQSIEYLPNQSNDEAFKTLGAMEASIIRINDDAIKHGAEFQNQSNEDQKRLEQITNDINERYREQQQLESSIADINSKLASVRSLETSTKQELEKSQQEYDRMQEEYNRKTRGAEIEDLKTLIPFYGLYHAGKRIYEGFDAGFFSSLKEDIRQRQDYLVRLKAQMNSLEQERIIISSNLSQSHQKIQKLKYEQEKLEPEQKALAAGVVLASNISVTCNSLKPKLFQVKNRIQDVRDTAEYFQGFNNVGEELMNLKNFLSKLRESISQLEI